MLVSVALRFPLPPLAGALLVLASCLGCGARLSAAQSGKPNLFGQNAGFEQESNFQDNLWDGVDGDGYLSGNTFSARVLTEGGTFGNMAMPPSVAFVDLNGDGKPDLITADPLGYFRFYANSGTPTAPRFTSAELIPFALGSKTAPGWSFGQNNRFCPRFSLADWRGSGRLDFLIGNYLGEILLVPNVGTARQPAFRLPATGIVGARISTTDQGHLWANLLAPAAADWTHHGKLDLLVGEGTYSANAIHLLENVGAASEPKFSAAKTTYLAYGDGREQLIPAVVDYNGDGNLDLIVADRTGEVGVYLSPGRTQAGVELKRASTISFGGRTNLPGLVAPYAVDFNGDGLFDLLFGLPNGRIAVALNTGTKGNPLFGPIEELKGVDRLGRIVNAPREWSVNTNPGSGNALAYFSVVSAREDPDSKPPEGAQCLKAAYYPPFAQTFAFPPDGMPGGSRDFALGRGGLKLEVNKTYLVSFKVKGSGMEKAHYKLSTTYNDFVGLVKLDAGERGAVRKSGDRVYEEIDFEADFNPGSEWQTVQFTATPHFKNPLLKDTKEVSLGLNIRFTATDLNSRIYFDDFQLIEQ